MALWSDLEGERRDGLPHVEGLSDRSLGVLLSHFRGEVGNAAGSRNRNISYRASHSLNTTAGDSLVHQSCRSARPTAPEPSRPDWRVQNSQSDICAAISQPCGSDSENSLSFSFSDACFVC